MDMNLPEAPMRKAPLVSDEEFVGGLSDNLTLTIRAVLTVGVFALSIFIWAADPWMSVQRYLTMYVSLPPYKKALVIFLLSMFPNLFSTLVSMFLAYKYKKTKLKQVWKIASTESRVFILTAGFFATVDAFFDAQGVWIFASFSNMNIWSKIIRIIATIIATIVSYIGDLFVMLIPQVLRWVLIKPEESPNDEYDFVSEGGDEDEFYSEESKAKKGFPKVTLPRFRLRKKEGLEAPVLTPLRVKDNGNKKSSNTLMFMGQPHEVIELAYDRREGFWALVLGRGFLAGARIPYRVNPETYEDLKGGGISIVSKDTLFGHISDPRVFLGGEK